MLRFLNLIYRQSSYIRRKFRNIRLISKMLARAGSSVNIQMATLRSPPWAVIRRLFRKFSTVAGVFKN